jgi:hypothetical protein
VFPFLQNDPEKKKESGQPDKRDNVPEQVFPVHLFSPFQNFAKGDTSKNDANQNTDRPRGKHHHNHLL